jgi:hypothetical protein
MKQGAMKQEKENEAAGSRSPIGRAPIGAQPMGGLAGWMLKRLRGRRGTEPRLAVLERIALAPRQTLALVEADGRRFLVATSPEGTPSFQALDPAGPHAAQRAAGASRPGRVCRPDRDARISW